MQDCGASCSIIQHHNRATIEREIATGMLELLYSEWGGYYVKKIPCQYSCMGQCSFLHFWSNCEHQMDFYSWENTAKSGKKQDIHKSWFSDMSVIINWIAVVFHVFQTQTVSKKGQLLRIQQLWGTDIAVHPFIPSLFPFVISTCHSHSSSTCLLLSIALFVRHSSKIEFYLGLLDIYFNILCCSSQNCPL